VKSVNDKNETTTREAIEDGVGIAETPQTNGDMSSSVPEDMAAAYDSLPERMTQEALEHVWIHTRNYVELAEQQGMRVFDHGKDEFLYDVYGAEYIDGLAGLWVVNAGHGRTEIADAMAAQAAKLAYVSSFSFTSVPAVELAEKIAALTPGDLQRVFFCSGGSEAVESAMKIAKQYQTLKGYGKRYKMIARRGSYHGATFGAMSLTGSRTPYEKYYGPLMSGVRHVAWPNCYRCEFGLTYPSCNLQCAKAVEQMIEFEGPETVAAVIAEPISTAQGTVVPVPEYLPMLREITERHGVLLILDEVINGWGRTGKYFATEHWPGVVPDIMTMAKGLSSGYAPIAAAVARPAVFEPFTADAKSAISHGLTFGGHAAAAAAAIKNIEIFAREGLVERAATMGEYWKTGLNDLKKHPTVGDVRGIGMLWAIEFVKNKESKERWGNDSAFIQRIKRETEQAGLLTRTGDIIQLAPPLVTKRETIDRITSIIDRAITAAEQAEGISTGN
jgi:adenosylmethionine-8-amino-7-oxononanoate aminotransferase